MIQEYALDPELIATKYLKDSKFFKEAFGPNSIRFLSCFPRRWRHEVSVAIGRLPCDSDEIAKKAILAFADSLLEKAITRRHGALATGSWLNKAEQEHQTEPFHAILTSRNPNRNDSVLEWDDVPGNQKWNDPRACHPRRTAVDLAATVEPLLMRAEEIIFVDPYFDIVLDEYRTVFERYFRCIENSLVSSKPRITIITALRRVQERGVREPSVESVTSFIEDCRQHLPAIIPQRCRIKIAILKENRNGQRLHDRFILTKNARIQFGTSLGCTERNSTSCENIAVYTYEKGESLWELYNLQRQPAAFASVVEPFTIDCDSGE